LDRSIVDIGRDARSLAATMRGVRVAFTLEQLWHRVPGGTGVAAVELARAIREGEPTESEQVELVGVAGAHGGEAPVLAAPAGMAIGHLPRPWRGPLLYEGWLRVGYPTVERAIGPIDVAHATTIIPCATRAPLVVTVHDLAFRHEPEHFTKRGVAVFERSLARLRRRADLVLASSEATAADLVDAGVSHERLRLVPLGVRPRHIADDVARAIRSRLALPSRYALFVGTVEPRKNLTRLVAAMERFEPGLPLVVAGAPGWGRQLPRTAGIHGVGYVTDDELAALYDGATVFCYPSIREGYGLPVLEAMSHGVPVVTSRGTSTEEVAGGAAVLVDPFDVDDIARGIDDALRDTEHLVRRGRLRAEACSWQESARRTVAAYREVAR
jgi:glycosyltransferase involved in cell wall biosynthesis